MSVRRTRMPNIAFPAAALNYTEKTTTTAITATSEATADTIITAGAVSVDGSTRVRITFHCPAVYFDDATQGVVRFALYEDGASIGIWGVLDSKEDGTGQTHPVTLERVMTPANGSRTYSCRGYIQAGTDNAEAAGGTGGSGQITPTFILITRCP